MSAILKIFAFLMILSTVMNSACPIGELVSTPEECTKYTKKDHHCCYVSSINPKLSMCLQMSKSVYNGLKKLNLGGVYYDIECGEEEKSRGLIVPGSPCGSRSPKTPEDCKTSSTLKSSCCYFEMGTNKGCYNLGFNRGGKINFGGMSLDC